MSVAPDCLKGMQEALDLFAKLEAQVAEANKENEALRREIAVLKTIQPPKEMAYFAATDPYAERTIHQLKEQSKSVAAQCDYLRGLSERLTEEVKQLRKVSDENVKLVEENEKLTYELAYLKMRLPMYEYSIRDHDIRATFIVQAQKDIHSLGNENQRLRAALDTSMDVRKVYAKRIHQLETALRDIAEGKPLAWWMSGKDRVTVLKRFAVEAVEQKTDG